MEKEKSKKINLKFKKSQISMFVIFGIISIILIVFLLFNSEFEFFISKDTKAKNQISTIVKDCVEKSSREGIFLLSFQAGYIKIPDYIKKNPMSYVDFGFIIPNWDTQKNQIPTLEFMQNELNIYVKNKSLLCINENLLSLNKSFDINKRGNFSANSKINDFNVVLDVDYLINFNEKNSEEILEIKDYVVILDDIKLGDIFNLAKLIYDTEKKNYIFEKLTLEQIKSSNDYSSKSSVPTEGMLFSCSKKIWTKEQLKKNIANLNNHNFKYLQFGGTYDKSDFLDLSFNENLSNLDNKKYYEKIYFYDLKNAKNSFKNYQVEVFMPSSQITGNNNYFKKYPFRKFEVYPSSGQIVESTNMKVDMGLEIPIPCIQVFHHQYSFDYDLIVKIRDKSENSNNLVFEFPIRVEVDMNQPKKSSNFNYNFVKEKSDFNNKNYCLNKSLKYPVMVKTFDSFKNKLEDVNISYKCLNLMCEMGKTSIPTYTNFGLENVKRENADSYLIANFPFCFNGILKAEKSGYHFSEKKIDTTDSLLKRDVFAGENLVELNLIKLKKYKVTPETFLIKFKETGEGFRVLNQNDGAIYFNLENKKLDFKSSAILPNDGEYLSSINFLEDKKVSYNLTVIFTDSDFDLKGMLEISNFKPNLDLGDNLQIVIPATKDKITEDNYLDFYEYFKLKSKNYNDSIIFY